MGYFLALMVIVALLLAAFVIAGLATLLGLSFWAVFIITLCFEIVWALIVSAR